MSSFSLWTLIKQRHDGYHVTVSTIALRSDVLPQAGDYLTERCATLEEAKTIGARLAEKLSAAVNGRGDEVVSRDTTIEMPPGM